MSPSTITNPCVEEGKSADQQKDTINQDDSPIAQPVKCEVETRSNVCSSIKEPM